VLCVSEGLCDFYKSLSVGVRSKAWGLACGLDMETLNAKAFDGSKAWGLACGLDMETLNAKAFDGRSIIVICKTVFLS